MKKEAILMGILMAMCTAAGVAQDTRLWPNSKNRVEAHPKTQVRETKHGIEIDKEPDEGWPGITLKLGNAPCDFTKYNFIFVTVSNRLERPCNIAANVMSGKGIRTGGAMVAPHDVYRLVIRLYSGGYILDKPVKLEGMREMPLTTDHDGFDITKIGGVNIILCKPKEPGAFTVLDITAAEGPFKRVKADGFFPFVDKYGQFMHDDWPGKIHSDAELKAARAQEDNYLAAHENDFIGGRDRWGGWKDGPQLKATGHFRVEKVDGKWWFVDPDGRLFYSHGIAHIPPGQLTGVERREHYFADLPAMNGVFASCWRRLTWGSRFYGGGQPYLTFDFGLANMIRLHGDGWRDDFYRRTHRRLRAWGMNTIGNWSDFRLMKMSLTPFTATLNTKGPRLAKSNEVWGDVPDPFSKEFEESIEKELDWACREGLDRNPWCIGFFVDNELAWHKCRGAEAERVAEKYYRTIAEAIRRRAPNKLYLGSRFMFGSCAAAWRAAARHCDVVSFNTYRDTSFEDLPEGSVDKPILIGEFHFGAYDRGMFWPGCAMARDQRERADCYRRFHESALRHPRYIGAHWFQWQDQALTARGDGENGQVGFVNIADQPYSELIEAARDIGRRMYLLRWGK